MKPLGLFGTPHNALVYVFVSHVHMSARMHMFSLHPSSGPLCQDLKLGTEQKNVHFCLLVDPARRSPRRHSAHSAQ